MKTWSTKYKKDQRRQNLICLACRIISEQEARKKWFDPHRINLSFVFILNKPWYPNQTTDILTKPTSSSGFNADTDKVRRDTDRSVARQTVKQYTRKTKGVGWGGWKK